MHRYEYKEIYVSISKCGYECKLDILKMNLYRSSNSIFDYFE